MIRLRHANEWVGLAVLAAVVLFLGIILQAGVLRDWFRTVHTLRIMLPESGVAGLSSGAEVEVLGTRVGTIRRVVIDPHQKMYAEAELEDQALAFVRRDSKAVIRRRFGVAGAAYVDIARGTGAPLDWQFAVIQGETERAPTESVGALIDEVREKVFPILDDAGRAMRALAETLENVKKGEGNVGRLLVDDTLIKDVEATIAQARTATEQIAALARTANAQDSGVPVLLSHAEQTLVSLQEIVLTLSKVAQEAPDIARNVESGTRNLGSLLTQTQQTVYTLDQLLTQLRGHWLLGGGDAPLMDSQRLPATEVRP
ncbi:MAG: MCE family protein [Alphaproteobacteria bacterium]|nr:MCE family protein [Alphaproteobacteria bacterium]